MLTWVPTAHGGLLQTFALPNPCIGVACVVGRMCAIGVIVDIALFLTAEALLYHLDEGLLCLCISLTRYLCGLLIGEAYAIQKIYHPGGNIRYSESLLYPFGYTLGIGINMPLQLFTEQADLPSVKTSPIALITIFQKTVRFSSEVKILVPINGSDVYTQIFRNELRAAAQGKHQYARNPGIVCTSAEVCVAPLFLVLVI